MTELIEKLLIMLQALLTSLKLINKAPKPTEAPVVSTNKVLTNLNFVDLVLKYTPEIPRRGLERALKWQNHAAVKNKAYILFVDFSKSDSKKRLFVINAESGHAEEYKVAHGKNSDANKDGLPDGFSNQSGSYKSSLGAVIIGNAFKNPKWKFVKLLDGIEKGLNDHIRAREILLHSTKYVNDVPNQAIGDTLGCFGVSEATAAKIFDKVGGCLLYAWDDSLS